MSTGTEIITSVFRRWEELMSFFNMASLVLHAHVANMMIYTPRNELTR